MIDWSDIVNRHGSLVWRTAMGILNHQADAADCFQETFTSALSATEKITVRHWPAFLKRIATTRALDILRRRLRDRQRRASLDDLGATASLEPEPAQHAEANELAERLRQALCRLPGPQSEIYCLRYLSEMSYDEIGSELGISVENVGVTLHRVRLRLRELLESINEVNHGRP